MVGLGAAMANAQIANSRHNFSSMGWSDGEICKPCHTPHFAVEGMPRLWNHALTTATYQMHEGTGTAVDNFDVTSRMCLSCHDGTVALDSFGGREGTNFIEPLGNLGTNLLDDHPVGSDGVYPTEPSTRFNPAVNGRVGSGTNTVRLREWNDNGTVRLVVGCTTCHNPHNRGNFPHMTVVTNSASNLCLICHIK